MKAFYDIILIQNNNNFLKRRFVLKRYSNHVASLHNNLLLFQGRLRSHNPDGVDLRK
ncbi:hypothetical protein NPIL_56671, partial [Nephila pilipes]